jgi:hypothetical protein
MFYDEDVKKICRRKIALIWSDMWLRPVSAASGRTTDIARDGFLDG